MGRSRASWRGSTLLLGPRVLTRRPLRATEVAEAAAVKLHFTLSGSYPADPAAYVNADTPVTMVTAEFMAELDRSQLRASVWEGDLLEWANDDLITIISADPLVTVPAGLLVMILQSLCDAQQHRTHVMMCSRVLCADFVAKAFGPREEPGDVPH